MITRLVKTLVAMFKSQIVGSRNILIRISRNFAFGFRSLLTENCALFVALSKWLMVKYTCMLLVSMACFNVENPFLTVTRPLKFMTVLSF